MKHLSKIVLLTLLLGIFIPTLNLQAAENFISDFRVDNRRTQFIRFCWGTAEQPPADPIIVYQKTGDDSTRTTYGIRYGLIRVTASESCFTVNDLQDDTSYTFWVKYEDGTTANGNQLSDYADYDEDEEMIVSQPYSVYTTNDELLFNTVDKSYVYPGEKVRLYGENIPLERSTNIYLYNEAYYTSSFDTTNLYQLEISRWTPIYIEFEVPEYDADMEYQSGKIYLDSLIPSEGNYNNYSQLFVKVLSGDDDVDRSLASGYEGEMYRYLLNASRYRYNQKRTSQTHIHEANAMSWVANYLTDLGKGIDATWSLVLAYGMTYGGYSQNEIQHEINFGPGCIHTTIPQRDWKEATDYAECMVNSL